MDRQICPSRQEDKISQLLLGPQHMKHVPLGTVNQQLHQDVAACAVWANLVHQHNAAVLIAGIGAWL